MEGMSLEGWLDLSPQAFKSPFAQQFGVEACQRQVSTRPVVLPLAVESPRPCGRAK